MWNAPHRLVSLNTWSQLVALFGKAVEIGGQSLAGGHRSFWRALGFPAQLHFLVSDSWQWMLCYLPGSPISAAVPFLNDVMVPLNSSQITPSFPLVTPVRYLVIARRKATDRDGKTVLFPAAPCWRRNVSFKISPPAHRVYRRRKA